jgi:hypothetical protein
MPRVVYIVSDGEVWKVRCEHCTGDVLSTQADALKVAKDHVAALPKGTLMQILIQGHDGTFEEKWSCDKDPFPPV